ncbi:helix-turn-helix transcriptional regulator [Tumebacillus sp. ITR2]|uniref:Helix-turn-helix transcriptional regulator n=1 Tax=Tumebacillus amylolyticus TaxID=2801339 RepID=A0ABS1J786_9BACL|nr:helix-turn-helix transcriptional regulator [Tumebacillus amylolyticus]MBL0385909.1 helix-turn-helix transcriptional regulator [Tumebacillus amylolyticus]
MLIKAKKPNLKKTRAIAGFTQRSLGEQTQLSSAFLSQVENGTRNVSAPNAKMICAVLDCNFDDIFEIVEHDPQSHPGKEVDHEPSRKLFKLKGLGRARHSH